MSTKNRAADKERFGQLLKTWVDQFAASLVNTDTKNYIQQLVIEPFLEYILQRSFPYLMITICLFSAMLIIVILIFAMLMMNRHPATVCPFCNKMFS